MSDYVFQFYVYFFRNAGRDEKARKIFGMRALLHPSAR
jgi:hypothetical protein